MKAHERYRKINIKKNKFSVNSRVPASPADSHRIQAEESKESIKEEDSPVKVRESLEEEE